MDKGDEPPGEPPPLPPGTPLNTATERLLYNHLKYIAYMRSKETNSLKVAITTLEEKIATITSASSQGANSQDSEEKDAYETDEDQVEQETAWITQKKKKNKQKEKQAAKATCPSKKRKAEESPVTSPKSSSNDTQGKPKLPKKEPAPPPVFVQQINDIKDLTQTLKTMGFTGKITSLSCDTSFKINCTTGEEYRQVTQWLNNAGTSWHTFSNAQTRPLKVMARGIHHKTEPEEVIDDLKQKGFKIIGVTNILNKEKKPLRLHMLTFDNDQDVKKVYEIKVIAYQAVKIENFKKTSTRIAQCQNCQGYNHTKTYCHRPAKCVKCAGSHSSQDCTKSKDTPPKCVNCAEPHTANYRGCVVAKELQKLKNHQGVGKTKDNKNVKKSTQVKQEAKSSFKQVKPNVSYAQTAGGSENLKYPASNDNNRIVAILERLEKKVDQQEQFNKMVLNRLVALETKLIESEA